MGERLFSDEELVQLRKRTLDRLLESIEAGDVEQAKRIAQRMYNEFLSMHDLYRDWITATLSFIARRDGESAVEEALREGVTAWWLPNLEKTREADLRVRIKKFIAGLRGHLQPLQVEEDDEKVVIQMRPCGSGGRLVLEGKYQGKKPFHTIKGAQFLTYGRPSFPVYCAHEPVMELLDAQRNGAPFVVVEPAERLGVQHCSFIIYKDPNKIPAKYYERLGLKKPAAPETNKPA